MDTNEIDTLNEFFLPLNSQNFSKCKYAAVMFCVRENGRCCQMRSMISRYEAGSHWKKERIGLAKLCYREAMRGTLPTDMSYKHIVCPRKVRRTTDNTTVKKIRK